MNLISGSHRKFERKDGSMPEDERRMQFGHLMDRLFPALIIAFLGWLCIVTTGLQSQVAVLVERSSGQSTRVDRLQNDVDGLRTAQSELQREIEEVKSH
jgi:hypothetical protein